MYKNNNVTFSQLTNRTTYCYARQVYILYNFIANTNSVSCHKHVLFHPFIIFVRVCVCVRVGENNFKINKTFFLCGRLYLRAVIIILSDSFSDWSVILLNTRGSPYNNVYN